MRLWCLLWQPPGLLKSWGEAENACKARVLPWGPVSPLGSCRWGLRSLGDLFVAVPPF